MKHFIVWVAAACMIVPACKKETVIAKDHPQGPATEQVLKDLAQRLEETRLQVSGNAPANQRLAEPVNAANPLDFVGQGHNRKIKGIIALTPANPSVEAIFNAYQNAPLIRDEERQVIGSLDAYRNYIGQGKAMLYRVENGQTVINPQAYRTPHFSDLTNAVLLQFFDAEAAVPDYNLRRALALTTEQFIATAGVDEESQTQILGTISLFKWSDYFWNNEYAGPLDMAKPTPAFWDVLWVKFNGPGCDSQGPTIPSTHCWLDVINGSSALSSLFTNISII